MKDESDHLEILVRVANDMQAAVVVNAMAEHGIHATAVGGFTSGFQVEVPGDVQVLVQAVDLARAKEILTEIEQHEIKVDWSKVDLGEPDEA